MDFYYDDTNGLVGFGYNGLNYYYIRNHQKDITGILDSDGNQVVSYVYDSWGKLVSTSGILADTIGVQNPYRYRGYYYDVETGFYYLQNRYYDPVTGRFINSDSLIGSTGELNTHNMFAYCGNEPINRVDPAGFAWYYPFNQYSDSGLEKKSYPFTSVSDSPPTYKKTNNAVNNIVSKGSSASNLALGTTEYTLNKYKKVVSSTVRNGDIEIAPHWGESVPRFSQQVKVVNYASTAITGIAYGYELGQTLENSSYSNGQKAGKIAIDTLGVAASVGVGYLAVAAANAWNPAGWAMLAAGATYLLVCWAGDIIIDYTKKQAYTAIGIS